MTLDNSNWDKITLGDIARSLTIAAKDPLSEGVERYVGLEHIDPGNIHIKSWGNVADGTTFTRIFRKGQVLFGKRRAYQKKAAMAEFDGVCSGDILVCEAIENAVLPELLPFIVQSDHFFEYAIKTSAGSLSPRTKFKDLAKFSLRLPKLDKQKPIADLLWSIDEAIERWALVLGCLDLMQQTILKELLLSKRITYKKIGEFGTVVTGKTPPTGNKKLWDGHIPFVTPSDMQEAKKFIDRTERYVTDAAIQNGKVIPAESLLVVCIASIGKLAINTKACITNQQINAVISNNKKNLEYLYYILDGKPEILKRVAGHSVVPIINKSLFEEVKIPYSEDLKEREEMVNSFSDIDQKKIEIFQHILKTKAIYKQIINQIFG